MAYKVRATFWNAFRCATFGGAITFMDQPSNEWISEACARRLIEEKGYPEDTIVEIDGDDPMDMVLVTEPDGSWELV